MNTKGFMKRGPGVKKQTERVQKARGPKKVNSSKISTKEMFEYGTKCMIMQQEGMHHKCGKEQLESKSMTTKV